MGVRGLTTYINCNQNAFLQYYLLHDTNLVIDGNSLCAQLYISLNCFSAFGGDYDKYAAYVKVFFKNLRKCNITPYVIFDGSYVARKLKTAYNRVRSKINGASKLDPVTQGSLQIFPLLFRDVFKEVLTAMNVSYTVCEFEADDEIAVMARYLKCPLLSYDSDFFIYNVMYVPFNTLELKPKPVEENGKRIYVLECKIYRFQYMADNFGGLKEEMLPLLATLLGNDYVEKRVFNKFFSQLKLPKSRKKKNEQQRCIHGLFKWLQQETLDSAIEKILGRLKKRQKNRVLAIIKKSIEGYKSNYCRSLKFFNICHDVTTEIEFQTSEEISEDTSDVDTGSDDGTGEDEDDSSSDDDNSSECDEGVSEEHIDDDEFILGLPSWFADGIRNNVIPQSYINLYTFHLYFCSPQAEDYSDEDSFLLALPILRYAFDIITDFSYEYCIYVCRRGNSSYCKMKVGKEFATSRILEKPFCELSSDQLHLYFENFIKDRLPSLDLNVIALLPSNFQLFMISLLWWVANCNIPLANVHSLLISYIMLEVIDEKIGTIRGHNYFNNKYSKKIEELKNRTSVSHNIDVLVDNKLFLNKNKVLYEDCLIAASVLLKYFEIDDSIRKRPKSYDVKRMHSFARFQCCLQQFNCLNRLCHNPFEDTIYSKCYNGTFVYNIALKLEDKIDPVNFLHLYLRGSNTVLMYYKSLCIIYEKCAEAMCLQTTKWTVKKRNRRKKVDKDDLSFILKEFESEVVI